MSFRYVTCVHLEMGINSDKILICLSEINKFLASVPQLFSNNNSLSSAVLLINKSFPTSQILSWV